MLMRPACIAVSISGLRHTSNNYMIDGISNNDRYYGDSVLNQVGILGVPATLVPMDAIAEFTVQQTPSAEFGVKGGAAINVVMKSGTNVVHGTGYYFRHDDFHYYPSKNPFADLGAPDLQQETIAQHRTLTNTGLRSDITYTHGGHNVKAGRG